MSSASEEETPRHSDSTQEDKVSLMPATILVVDDDQVVRSLLCEALSLHGYRVIATATAQEANAALQQLGPATIGLVIADVHLTADPQAQEGYALYERWATVEPAPSFLLISGDPSSQALPAVRAGAVRFLAKPFAMPGLLIAVRALLRA